MMNVVPLRQPDSSVVALLKSLLRQAEAGEIVSLIYSVEVAGGKVENGYSKIEDIYCMIGQLERMKSMLLNELNGPMEEVELSE
jgi:hypothetical protein